ncbi:MAG: FHA domain-containing protein [Candidatus Brocadiae bacterium]|nr:FHA domain-containing protein [Candidatus Brocadiia bacterium]
MIPLGHLLDGLILFYNAYRTSKTPPITQSLSEFKRNLKSIYELLPAPCQIDYRKKKLKQREEDLKFLNSNIQNILLRKTKESISLAAEIYQSLLRLKGYHSTLFELGRVLGNNTDLAKYLFHEIAKNEEKVVILEIITCDKARDFLLLDQYPLVLGRDTSATENLFMVRDSLVSRPHCCLTREGSSILLEDMQSRNGTYVNGNMIREKALLKSGDKIRIGDSKIQIEIMNQEEIEGTFETKILAFSPAPSLSCQQVTLLTLAIALLFLLILAYITLPAN